MLKIIRVCYTQNIGALGCCGGWKITIMAHNKPTRRRNAFSVGAALQVIQDETGINQQSDILLPTNKKDSLIFRVRDYEKNKC